MHLCANMNGGNYELERQSILTKLLDATKECQVRFGGKTELATEVDSRVSCLCSVWESALQHGLKHSNRALSTLKQVTEKTGLTKMKSLGIIQDLTNLETEPVFWHHVREHLNKQELHRYHLLNSINTDAGRGRAWLRSTFNEHSLERYLHMLLEDPALMRQHYEDWAFLLDQEKASMMPVMAGGLNSILFAISIDNVDLNTIRHATGLDNFFNNETAKPPVYPRAEEEPRPVIAGDSSSPQGDRRKLKKKKKKPAHLVSFDEDDIGSSYSASPASSVTSPISSEAGNISQDVVSVAASEEPVQMGFFGDTVSDESALPDNCSTGTGGHSGGSSEVPGARRSEEWPVSPSELRTGAGTVTDMLQSDPSMADKDRPTLTDITSPTLNRLADLQNLIDNTQSTLSDQCDQNSLNAATGSIPAEENMKILDRNVGWRDAEKTVVTTQIGKIPVQEEDFNLLTSPAETLSKGHKRSVSEGFASLLMNSNVKPRHDQHSITEQDRSTSLENNLQKKNALPQFGSSASLGGQDWRSRLVGKADRTPSPTQQGVSRWDSLTSNDSTDFTSVASASSYEEKLSHSRNSSQDFSNRPEALPMFMTPVSPEGNPMVDDPSAGDDVRSTTSSDALSYLEDTSHASLAMSLAESSLKYSDIFRTQGDGSHTPEPAIFSPDTLTTVELKQAIVDMMIRKDEIEELNRRLKMDVHDEREHSLALQLELEEYRRSTQQSHDRDKERIQALAKENELLKHQLKKYVSAVQMLKSQNGASSADVGVKVDSSLAIPPPQTTIDYSHEASEYERKLIQVAEMHGELMEFNEVLHRQLNVRETQLHRLRQELITLRGPLPEDLQGSDDSCGPNLESDGISKARPLVNIWVPSVFLKGSPAEAHHVYQVFIRIKDEEWTVYKRYSEFYELHIKLKKKAPIVNTFCFPPKKALGNKDPKFVEERRKKLQQYLRQVIQLQLQLHPELSSGVGKGKLIHALPFLSDQPLAECKKGKGRVRRTKSRSVSSVSEGSTPGPSAYMGL